MVLRLDPRIPLVWRDPTTLQVGVDPVVLVLDDVEADAEQALAALVQGVSPSGFAMLAGDATAERLLDELGTAVLSTTDHDDVPATVALVGDPLVRNAIAEALSACGVIVLTAESPSTLGEQPHDLAVLVASHVVPPGWHHHWLRRDVPHLLVLLSGSGATVGPFIEPGSTACLRCLELHHTEEDAAWPAIASQLFGRRPLDLDPPLRLEVTAAAVRAVLHRAAGLVAEGSALRLDEDGSRSERTWAVHPRCGCAGLEEDSAAPTAVNVMEPPHRRAS